MVTFTARMYKYGEKGEKTGWTIVEVPNDITEQLNPSVKKSYRVKGLIDKHPIKSVALVPIGGGIYIMPINATMRKAIAKKEGAMVQLKLELDNDVYQLNEMMMQCLQEFPEAKRKFEAMPRSHQNYYSKWVETAKAQATQEKRIIQMISSLDKGLSFSEMLKEQSALKKI